ncbi:PHO85 cyclin-5 [Basidiobolus ranarum]|uniref:PHO85 cyclin-5 n=1 Tax=Basidiobolus ranarum TaxID=34480 RepID=A0ABR2X089_9FUNG
MPDLSKISSNYGDFVECLVDAVEYTIESIWYAEASLSRTKRLLLRAFIRETIKSSRVYYSTVMISLLYLYRLKRVFSLDLSIINSLVLDSHRLPKLLHDTDYFSKDFSKPLFDKDGSADYATLSCNSEARYHSARSSFIGAIIAASKFHQERSPTNYEWARFSKMSVREVGLTEIAFLQCLKYQLFVPVQEYELWSEQLMREVRTHKVNSSPPAREKFNGYSKLSANRNLSSACLSSSLPLRSPYPSQSSSPVLSEKRLSRRFRQPLKGAHLLYSYNRSSKDVLETSSDYGTPLPRDYDPKILYTSRTPECYSRSFRSSPFHSHPTYDFSTSY